MIKKDAIIFILVGFIVGLFAGICITLMIVKIAEEIAIRKYEREERRRGRKKESKSTKKIKRNQKEEIERKSQDFKRVKELSEKERIQEMLKKIPVHKDESLLQQYDIEDNYNIYGNESFKQINTERNSLDREIVEKIGRDFYIDKEKRKQKNLNLKGLEFDEQSLYQENILPEFKESKETSLNALFLLYEEEYLFLNWHRHNLEEKIELNEVEDLNRCYHFINENDENCNIKNLRRNVFIIGSDPAIVARKENRYVLKKKGILKIKEVY